MCLKQTGAPICVTVTLMDGLVLARATFHHSFNYRSCVILGSAEPVTDMEEKRAALEAIVEHIVPGRSAEVCTTMSACPLALHWLGYVPEGIRKQRMPTLANCKAAVPCSPAPHCLIYICKPCGCLVRSSGHKSAICFVTGPQPHNCGAHSDLGCVTDVVGGLRQMPNRWSKG